MKKGFILIVLMWVLVILGAIAGSVMFVARLELKKAGYALDRVRAVYLASGAAEIAKAEINRDRNSYDSLSEPWSYNPDSYNYNEYDLSYNIKVRDEESKINLNSDTHELIKNLLKFNGAGNYDEISQALADWTDADTEKRKNGAENEYYRTLNPPYPCKDAQLDATDELLLVKGVHYRTFKGIVPFLTVYGSRKINFNTASDRVFAAIPGITPRAIKSLLSYRQGPDEKDGTKDDRPFISVESAASLLDSRTAERVAEFAGVKSEAYTAEITVSAGRARRNVECIMLKRPFSVDIISWKEL